MRKRGSAPVRRGNRLSLELGPENATTDAYRLYRRRPIILLSRPTMEKTVLLHIIFYNRYNTIGVKCVPDSNVVSVCGV